MKTRVKNDRHQVPGRKICLLILLITISLLPVTGFPQPVMNKVTGLTGRTPWTLLKQDSGIELYERLICLEGYPEGRQLGITFVMKGDIATALLLVSDERMASRWMTAVKSFQILEKEEGTCWYSYILYDIPWPLRKQDLIICNTLSGGAGDQAATIEMLSSAEYLPENKGVSRITHMYGTWYFNQKTNEQVEVSYTVFSGQRSAFPRWITDPIIQGNLLRTMDNFRKAGEEQFSMNKSITRKE